MKNLESKPATAYERVRKSKLKAVNAGGRRAPDGILSPGVAAALDDLVQAGYASSAIGAVSAALLDAHRKINRK